MAGNTQQNTEKTTPPGFEVRGQPSPEAKRAGWERRRMAQRMMDKIANYMEMTNKSFQDIIQDIKDNPDKYTVEDALLARYATKAFNGDKFMLDWIDRNISKAPVQNEHSGVDGGVIKFKYEGEDE